MFNALIHLIDLRSHAFDSVSKWQYDPHLFDAHHTYLEHLNTIIEIVEKSFDKA